ncbi:D-alanyl-D-alanine carboxypeptidase [Streptomyces luteireticuli]|uniref:D-alanyl-D-alanine carboxypeptidase n=1 Tax=Streptomyces luteireticuli TaxID=173858 RepID=A0ABN0YR54_9ACTN
MAGESPDKSEQGKPSGETAGEHDPRLGVLREPKAPAEPDSEAAPRHDGARTERAGARPAATGTDADAKPAKREEAEDSRPKDGASRAAAEVSGADRPKNGSAPAGDDRLKAAVASWVASADEDGPETIADSSEDDRPAASAADRSADSSADQPTALLKAPVVEAPKPKQVESKQVESKSAAPKAAGSGSSSADQPTALLKAPVADAQKPAETAAPAKADSAGPDPSDQPTALIKAPEVETPKIKAPAAPPKGAPTGDERASRFVPLKSDDAPAAPPKPARPAVPVKVAPPAPAAPAARPQQLAGPDGPERTTQTPLPVGPDGEKQAPLDLLAQLTNTPPPPETPVRSTVRRLKIYTPIAVLLLIVFCVVQAVRPLPNTELSLGKQAAYTFGGEKFSMKWPEEGQSAAKVVGVGDLGTFGDQKPVPTASMAKVMTAYIILRDHPLKMKKQGGQDVPEQGPMIKIDAQAEKEAGSGDESRIEWIKAGQTYSEYDMLQMLLIPSGNNIARQLARWDSGGSEAPFVKKMNDAAKELGMKRTTYTDPSGFDKTTVSTASDQVLLAERVITNPVVRSITTKPNAKIKDGGQINSNIDDLLLKRTGVLGIKTGSTTAAGGALMWAARKRFGDEEVLIVGTTMDQHWKKGPDVQALMSLKMAKDVSYEQLTAVQNGLQEATVVKKGQVVGYVDDQLGGKTPVVATKDVKGFGWGGMKAKFALKPKAPKGSKDKTLPHSAKAGTVVGELVVGSGPDAVKVPVALQKALSEPSFGSKLTRLG